MLRCKFFLRVVCLTFSRNALFPFLQVHERDFKILALPVTDAYYLANIPPMIFSPVCCRDHKLQVQHLPSQPMCTLFADGPVATSHRPSCGYQRKDRPARHSSGPPVTRRGEGWGGRGHRVPGDAPGTCLTNAYLAGRCGVNGFRRCLRAGRAGRVE